MIWRSRPCFLASIVSPVKLHVSKCIPRCRRSGGLPYSRSPIPVAADFDCQCPASGLVRGSQVITSHTLKARCSKKCATPFVFSVSALLPASIHTPTVDVCAQGECWVAICGESARNTAGRKHQTVKPFGKVVHSVWVDSRGVANPLRRGWIELSALRQREA